MTLTQIEYFCTACMMRSLTKAADAMYVTQPTVSSAIKALEDDFGVKLFQKVDGRFALTAEGEVFYNKAKELLEAAKETHSYLLDVGKHRSSIKIGIPPLLSTIFFPGLLSDFMRRYPEVDVTLAEYGSARAAALVRKDELDLALVNLHFYNLDKMNYFSIGREEVVFTVGEDDELAKLSTLDDKLLDGRNVILYNTDSVQNITLKQHFERAGVTPHVILQASQLLTIENFIKQGYGGAFLYSSIQKLLKGTVGLSLEPQLFQEIGLVWNKGRYVSAGMEKFIDYTAGAYKVKR